MKRKIFTLLAVALIQISCTYPVHMVQVTPEGGIIKHRVTSAISYEKQNPMVKSTMAQYCGKKTWEVTKQRLGQTFSGIYNGQTSFVFYKEIHFVCVEKNPIQEAIDSDSDHRL